MVRVTYGAPRHQKKVRYFKQARGFRGGRSKLWRTVQEALLVMTRAKSGIVAVLNKTGKLAGVFSDGDLRRLMTTHGDSVLARPLSKVMSKKPITIREDALAVEALAEQRWPRSADN